MPERTIVAVGGGGFGRVREYVGFREEQLNHSTRTLMCWN